MEDAAREDRSSTETVVAPCMAGGQRTKGSQKGNSVDGFRATGRMHRACLEDRAQDMQRLVLVSFSFEESSDEGKDW